MASGSNAVSFRLCGLTVRLPGSRTSLILWGLAVMTVVCGSLLPSGTLHKLQYDRLHLNDKLVHGAGYCVLALIPVTLLEFLGLGLALAASMIPMGICLEFAQRLIPGRSFELGDMVANTTGVLVGVAMAISFRRVLRLHAVPSAR